MACPGSATSDRLQLGQWALREPGLQSSDLTVLVHTAELKVGPMHIGANVN